MPLCRIAYPIDLLALHARKRERYPHLFQSNQSNSQECFDILFALPQMPITADKTKDFFQTLDDVWQKNQIDSDLSLDIPFRGGWMVYLGYEMIEHIESCLVLPDTYSLIPKAYACRIPAAIIQDHYLKQTYIIAEEDAQLELIWQDYQFLANSCLDNNTYNKLHLDLTKIIEEPPDLFLKNIAKIKAYIKAGDIFQANLSRLWQLAVKTDFSADYLFSLLAEYNPAPFSSLISFDKNSYIISASPERLIKRQGEWLETRPIAGTIPRLGKDEIEKNTLINHPKERAEHIMLVDLERNDLGKVCQFGTVKVNELMVLESYKHVHHIVSNIKGKIKPNITPGQILKAVFPGGTITGCPKVHCIEILAQLEKRTRGPYTGSVGYINHDGSMDFNILIRTFWLEQDMLFWRTGAGIVMDSNPEQELLETYAKAQGLINTLKQL